MLPGELSTFLEVANDFVAIGQVTDLITTSRMCLDRKNLAIDPETANAIVGTELKSRQQGIGILPAKPTQLPQGVLSFHLADGGRGRGDELDRLVTKHAAEAEADHEGYQFIRVIPATQIPKKQLRDKAR